MNEQEFVRANGNAWKELESELKLFRKISEKQNIDKHRIDRFVSLYNKAANNLAYSRTYFGECATTNYLNRLVGQAHSFIYSSPESKVSANLRIFTTGFPSLLRKYFKAFIIATLIFTVAFAFSYIVTAISIDNALLFLPRQLLAGSRQEGQYDEFTASVGTYYASMIGTNNIRVSFMAFALGITLGIGTIYILAYNGLMLGALAGVYFHRGQSVFFWSLILPHGVSELFAIFVSGAAGLIIGYSLINPGKISRKDALITKGMDAVKLVIGCIPILVISALIEGFFTPLDLPYVYKYVFSLTMLCLLILYCALPGREREVQEPEKILEKLV